MSETLPTCPETEWVEMSNRRIPKYIVCHVLRMLDNASLAKVSQVSRAFRQMANNPTVFAHSSASYTGQNPGLPEFQKVIAFPPPALVGTTLPSVTTVSTKPEETTSLPADTTVIIPVLPEAVPMYAQVPDVMTVPGKESNKVQISQVLPGYAPSYATDYVPPEVSGQSFHAFANTISFNVSRYPALSEVVDSKSYSKRRSAGGSAKNEDPIKDNPTTLYNAATIQISSQLGKILGSLEYVPAEYFRGSESLLSPPTMSVACSSRIDFVKPDVLASGRLLTNMTSQAVTTTNSTSTTLASGSVEDTIATFLETDTLTQNGNAKEDHSLNGIDEGGGGHGSD